MKSLFLEVYVAAENKEWLFLATKNLKKPPKSMYFDGICWLLKISLFFGGRVPLKIREMLPKISEFLWESLIFNGF
jgi:hypothetical protein